MKNWSHIRDVFKNIGARSIISNTKFYIDDGWSGANFNRPGFEAMIGDVDTGLIGTIICKDMSRFGRDYLHVVLYTEIKFPEAGIRFIAINDGVDSANGVSDDFTPFRNIINEWYCRDISKKIKASMQSRAKSGEHLTGNPPYGYRKDQDSFKQYEFDVRELTISYALFRPLSPISQSFLPPGHHFPADSSDLLQLVVFTLMMLRSL